MMSVQEHPGVAAPEAAPERTRGEAYERLAFTFCKTATLVLLTWKFALPVAAGGAAVFYVLAELNGKKDTRCILRMPLLIAGFWGVICLVSLYGTLAPMLAHLGK
jgi:hypothetical protein